MYPCVSFVYLSLLSLSVLLFKIFNFRFHVFLTVFFSTCVLATLAIRHNARARSVRSSCLYMQNIFVLFVPGYSAITICFSWTFVCRDLQLAKDSHGGEADCKELVNP